MSPSKKKRLRVTIPAVRVMGNDQTNEEVDSLQKSRKRLRDLEIKREIIETEDDIERTRRSIERRGTGTETPPAAPKNELAERLVEQVIIPLANKKLQEDSSSHDKDMVDRALRVAEKSLDGEAGSRGRGSPKNLFSDAVAALKELREFTNDPKMDKRLDDIEGKLEKMVEGGSSEEKLDSVFGTINKVKEFFTGLAPSGAGDTDATKLLTEQRQWEKKFDRTALMRDRAYGLAIRKQDKAHEIELAKLGIEKQRNKMFEEGLQRVGKAIAAGLGEDDDEEEEAPSGRKRSRAQAIWKGTCQCGAEVIVPPASQVEGKEIECGKCEAVFTWFQE